MDETCKLNLENYNKEISKHLLQLCEPLLKYFKDFSVGYKRCYHNGNLLMIETKIEWYHAYLSMNIYDEVLHDNVTQARSKNDEYVYILSGLPTNKVHSYLFDLNVWNSISLHFPHEKYEEVFHFCAPRTNQELINLYVNNRGLFHHFVLYLRERLNLLKIQEAPLFTLSSTSSSSSLETPRDPIQGNSIFCKVRPIDLENFFNSTSIKKFYFKDGDFYITKRELECVYYLCQGFTVKHIARGLQISPRTVEFHIKHIKNKLCLYSKNELVTFLHRHFSEEYLKNYEKYCRN